MCRLFIIYENHGGNTMDKNTSNHFLGINWTVRSKHPQFWLGIVLSILVPPLAYTGTEFNEVTSWGKFFTILGDGFKNPYIVLMMLVGIYNTIVDKTTKGFGDSYIAKQYLRPRTDYDPKQALDWEVKVNQKAQAKDKARKEREEKLELEENEKNLPVKNKEEISDNDISPERKELTPTEFDTSQPFTDDTDEVEFDVADYEYDEELKRGASRYHDDEVLKESEKDGR